jgi:hypothetical protein
MYEYGTLKPDKVILRREKGRGRMEGMNQIEIQYIYSHKKKTLYNYLKGCALCPSRSP